MKQGLWQILGLSAVIISATGTVNAAPTGQDSSSALMLDTVVVMANRYAQK